MSQSNLLMAEVNIQGKLPQQTKVPFHIITLRVLSFKFLPQGEEFWPDPRVAIVTRRDGGGGVKPQKLTLAVAVCIQQFAENCHGLRSCLTVHD